MSEQVTAEALREKVSAHGERIKAVETTQEDHARRLEHHGKSIQTITMMGWGILGGVVTNILITIWKR